MAVCSERKEVETLPSPLARGSPGPARPEVRVWKGPRDSSVFPVRDLEESLSVLPLLLGLAVAATSQAVNITHSLQCEWTQHTQWGGDSQVGDKGVLPAAFSWWSTKSPCCWESLWIVVVACGGPLPESQTAVSTQWPWVFSNVWMALVFQTHEAHTHSASDAWRGNTF